MYWFWICWIITIQELSTHRISIWSVSNISLIFVWFSGLYLSLDGFMIHHCMCLNKVHAIHWYVVLSFFNWQFNNHKFSRENFRLKCVCLLVCFPQLLLLGRPCLVSSIAPLHSTEYTDRFLTEHGFPHPRMCPSSLPEKCVLEYRPNRLKYLTMPTKFWGKYSTLVRFRSMHSVCCWMLNSGSNLIKHWGQISLDDSSVAMAMRPSTLYSSRNNWCIDTILTKHLLLCCSCNHSVTN